MQKGNPLRYNISDWHQLVQCKSNTSKRLKITVSDFVQDDRLSGLNISVNHPDFGTLFAATLNAAGSLIEEFDSQVSAEFAPDRILLELKKYGFYITFNKRANLPASQLEYLMVLDKLGYAKIRLLRIAPPNSNAPIRTVAVAFTSVNNPRWLNNEYQSNESEFVEALDSGNAINISGISETNDFDWSWLDYVANVQDILSDNA